MPAMDISIVPIFCSVLESQGRSPCPEDQRLLEAYTTLCTWYTERNFGLGRFVHANDAPGYLKTQVNGRSYYVPYILVSVFPTADQLNHIDTIVDLVRLSSTSAFCLSGSATFLGRIASVTDLDFCEYYIGDAASIEKHIPQKMDETGDCNLIGIKSNEKVWLLPFSEPSSISLEGGSSVVVPPPVKFDFLVSTDYFGAIAATNLVLPTDPDFLSSENLAKSFQFQEAVIFDNESMPKRSLLNPREIGAYMNWLHNEAIKYRDAATQPPENNRLGIKALKRAMSWFLMAGLGEPVDRIAVQLQCPEMDYVISIAKRSEVDRFLKSLSQNSSDKLRKKLKIDDEVLISAPRALDEFFNVALSLASNLITEIELLCSAIQPDRG